MSEREVLERLVPYVPPYWVRQVLADPMRTLAGREERIYAAVLFVDISGFTPISEALSRKGHEGVEELSSTLERYFTRMSEIVLDSGGEVVKFAGDSLIVIFPAQVDQGEAHLGAAIHCSSRMQEAMAEFANVETSAGTFPLQIKIGISEGSLYNTTVGDEQRGMQPVLAGLPLARCQEAESMAGAGEIVIDAALLSRTPGRLDIGEARETFRLVAGATEVPVLPPTEQTNVAELALDQATSVFRRLAPYLPTQLVERIRQGRRGVYGEHRRVTVMFVKFGGLNYDWDPDVGSVLQIYFRTMRDCILGYGGRLNEVDIRSDGGSLVVFFGAPTAHEDDELRAVACAWEMQQAVANVRLEAGEAAEHLRQCIGITSGPVFVGDVGAPQRRTYAAVGDEVNLAARLMVLAHWGEVVISGWVQKLAAGAFEFEAMGETQLKGKADPVPVYALVGPRQEGAQDGLFSQLMDRRPLISREDELATLKTVSEQAWQGHPQLVLITGEAGLGKSRLVGEAMQDWVSRGGRAYVGDCRGQGADLTYVPWGALLRTIFGLKEADSPERQYEKIETLLTFMSPSLARRADLFADVLQVDVPQDPLAPILSPVERDSQLHDLLRDFFRIIAQRQPLVLVFENMQDIDDASLSLLNDFLEGLRGFPLLICATYRPHEDFELAEQAVPTTRLVLDELSEADSLTFAQSLLDDVGLSIDLAYQIVNQTQGNPFYLQETVRALADAAPAGDLDAAEMLSEGMIIPDSISDTIQTQLDRLDEDLKLTLHIAAVIGRQFSFRVLQEAHPLPVSQRDLAMRLATLERMHVLNMAYLGEDIHYRFRQLMTQQVIYGSTLRIDRERFHRRVAESLEKVYADDLETRHDLLADHFTRGNVPLKAATYLILAGHHAVRAGADREALVHYDGAESLLPERAACPGRCLDGLRLGLLLQRSNVHHRLVNIRQAIDDSRRATALASRLVDLESLGVALLGLGDIALHQARYLDASVILRRAMQPFSSLGDRGAMARTLLLTARIQALQGHHDGAARLIERATALAEQQQDQSVLIDCKSWQGVVSRAIGQFRQATDALNQAIRIGRRIGKQETVARSLSELAQVLMYRGRWGQALQLSRESLQISQTLGAPLAVADAQRAFALILIRAGAYEEAQSLLDDALPTLADANWRVELMAAFWTAGEVCLALGHYDQARDRYNNALALGRESNTVEAVVRAQLGLSKLAAVERNWPQGQHLCTEARARARQAKLEMAVVAARLWLARAHVAREDWRSAQREASLAHDSSSRMRCPYETVLASATLGEALVGLAQESRAQHYFAEAHANIQRLASTLPPSLAQVFLNRPYMRTVRGYAGERLTSEVA